MTKDTRIHWTKEEMALLARACIDEHGSGKWSISPQLAVKRIQAQVLPPERCRSLKSLASAEAVAPFIRVLEAQKAKCRVIRDAPAPAPAPAPQQEETFEDVGVLATTSRVLEAMREEPAPAPAPALKAVLVDVASDLIAEVLVESVRKLLTHPDVARMLNTWQLGHMPAVVRTEPVPKHNPVPASAPKADQLSLLVCGFKPHQQSQFLTAFPDLHLRFWYAERPNEGLNVLKEKARGADAVLFTMEATSHSAVAVVQALGRKIVRVTGGGTAMQAAINALRAKEAA